MFEPYYSFFDKFADENKIEELEMETDLLYLGLAEGNLYDCLRSKKKTVRENLREIDCTGSFRADSKTNLFRRTCCSVHK